MIKIYRLPPIGSTLYIVLLVIVLFSCEKEVGTSVTPSAEDETWHDHLRFTSLTRIKTNLAKSDDGLYVLGPYFHSVLSPNNLVSHSRIRNNLIERLPINSQVYIDFQSPTNSYLLIRPNESPIDGASMAYIDLLEYDSTFTEFKTNYLVNTEIAALSEDNQVLIAYNSTEGRKLALIKPVFPLVGYPSIASVHIIVINDNNQSINSGPPYSINNHFYIELANLTESALYRIDSLGQCSKATDVSNGILELFEYNGTLYATEDFEWLYISNDDGLTWTKQSNFPRDFILAKYHQVGDSLVGNTGSANLFTLKFDGANWKARFLENKGIEGQVITSVLDYGDSVYISTLGGLFSKSLESFFVTKD
jgi:hypothetical protein